MAGDAIAQGLGGKLVAEIARATQSPSC